MVNYKGIISQIVVDGSPLPEYGLKYDPEEAQISCWVASQTGKEFHIILQRHTRDYVTMGDFFVDGENVACLVAAPTAKQDILRCQGIQISATMRRPLLFSKTRLTDDDALRNTEVSPDLGTIRVEYRRATLNGRADEYQPISVGLTGRAHESQKPSVHSAILGTEQATVPSKGQCRVDTGELILAVVFHYGPIDHLQAIGIVPRAFSPHITTHFRHPIRSPTPRQTSPARKRTSPPPEREYIVVDSDTDEEEGGSSLGTGEDPEQEQEERQEPEMEENNTLELEKLEAILAVARIEEQITDLKSRRKSWKPEEYKVALERLEARLKVLKAEEQLVAFKCAQCKKRRRSSTAPSEVKHEGSPSKKRRIVKQERSASGPPLKRR